MTTKIKTSAQTDSDICQVIKRDRKVTSASLCPCSSNITFKKSTLLVIWCMMNVKQPRNPTTAFTIAWRSWQIHLMLPTVTMYIKLMCCKPLTTILQFGVQQNPLYINIYQHNPLSTSASLWNKTKCYNFRDDDKNSPNITEIWQNLHAHV